MSSQVMAPQGFVKSEFVYLNDGNIILHANATEPGAATLFRVHKSILALHSATFRALFGDDSAMVLDNASEQFEGLPLMETHDDAKDLEDFLRALYYPEFIQRHNRPWMKYMQIHSFPKAYMGAMRLARKYDAPKLLAELQNILLDLFPREYPEAQRKMVHYQTLETEYSNHAQLNYPETYDHEEAVTYSLPDAAYAIRMAVDLNFPDILPTAFYMLMRHNDLIVEPGGEHNADPYCYGDLEVLTQNELRTFIVGSAAVRNWLEEHWITEIDKSSTNFINKSEDHKCAERFCAAWNSMCTRTRSASAQADPLYFLSRQDIVAKSDLCNQCRYTAQERVQTAGERLWAALPKLFHLAPYGVENNWGITPQ
ncbi:hypothetical protein PENSPDRAFT_747402 [Peniophora sp. CONT]|nr:hypothetical protein PENSPDRAFT_747402 [Peniophora sp. CONT]